MHAAKVAHSFLAILSGFVVAVGCTGIATSLLRRFAPRFSDDSSDMLAMAIHLGLSIVFSAAGGYVTARLTIGNPLVHTLALSLAILFFSGLSAVQLKGKQPAYYLLLLTVLSSMAALAGGLIRLHQMGFRW